MDPLLIVAGLVLSVAGLIKAFWMYDEYQYKKSLESETKGPSLRIGMLKAPPGGKVSVEVRGTKVTVIATGPGAKVEGQALGKPLPQPTIIDEMIAEELDKP